MSESKSMFEKLFTMSKEDVKKSKIPLVEKKIKRQLDSAYDDAEGKILEAEEAQEVLLKDFENFDINAILTAIETINACKAVQKDISDLYKLYFGEELEGWQDQKKK